MSFRVQLINMGTRAAACKYKLVSQQEKFSSKFSKMASQKIITEKIFLQAGLCLTWILGIYIAMREIFLKVGKLTKTNEIFFLQQFRQSSVRFTISTSVFFTIPYLFHLASISPTPSNISLKLFSVSFSSFNVDNRFTICCAFSSSRSQRCSQLSAGHDQRSRDGSDSNVFVPEP